jgi:hypothetical protein
MMSLFQQAARFNNDGVRSLLNGDQRGAIQSMGESIKVMKAVVSNTGASSAAAPSRCHSAIHETCTAEIPSMESSDTIVFNQAILIPADGDDAQAPGEFELNIYTSAVIFNLALAHHSRGDEKSMARAEQLYAMVIKLLKGNSLHMHTALIVKLACINNLSQIRYSKGDYKGAREGLNQVSGFILQNDVMLDEPGIQGLLMNALLLKPPTAAPAA